MKNLLFVAVVLLSAAAFAGNDPSAPVKDTQSLSVAAAAPVTGVNQPMPMRTLAAR